MANIAENPTWAEGVYQLETSDPVLGGPGGVSNKSAKNLADRTAYLKQQIENHLNVDNVDAGELTVEHGGTGRASLTAGRYLVGAGASAIALKTAAEVLADIKALPYYSSTPGTNVAPVIYVTGQGLMVWAGSAYAVLEATETVKGLIEIATAAEAQSLSDDIHALTPKKLADAFGGANQSLAVRGYQKLPGGLVLQWGQESDSGTSGSKVFPVAFPNAGFIVVPHNSESAASSSLLNASFPTTTGFNWFASGTLSAWCWFALGY